MKQFNVYLEELGEIGFVEEITYCLVYANGLPGARPNELVLFENGSVGQVLSLYREKVEILLFSANNIQAGSQVVRTNQFLEVPVGLKLLGQTVDPLGNLIENTKPAESSSTVRPIDVVPGGIQTRKRIDQVFETGITLVDLILPLGKGQRELVIGDRKTGKTSFLLQTVLTQARQGTICIYAAIGKKKIDIKKVEEFFKAQKVMQNIGIVATGSEDAPGLIYLTPYSAMTMAEYFRDQGRDVLVILDDLSTHAKFYREISLIGKKFPGRNSYPGDVFYTHARLLERAGNFISPKAPKGEVAITCIPVVETSQGNLSGYIQTNLMSMTDGHIYFDSDLFARGRRPAINPFLSVTRVGRQTQTNTRREINRELVSFMTLYEKMQDFVHFGAEVSQTVRHTLNTGDKIIAFLDQSGYGIIDSYLQVFLFCLLWIGIWDEKDNTTMINDMKKIIALYSTNKQTQTVIDTLISQAISFNGLLGTMRKEQNQLMQQLGFVVLAPVAAPAVEPVQTGIVKPVQK